MEKLSKASGLPAGYRELLEGIKTWIRAARLKAALAVNGELVLLYWGIGRDILERQGRQGWGAKVIDRLSLDLRREMPDTRGFSPRNLKYMRAFAEAHPQASIVQEVLAQLTWYQNIALIECVKKTEERQWYARQAIAQGWSRAVLVHQIKSDLLGRQGSALTNFSQTMPPEQSDLAREVVKDPYAFDFLQLGPDADERILESGLIERMQGFLLELGRGFSFVGRQVRLEVGGEEYFVDLLFYHLRLRCYVVIELKIGAFKPEYAGKMSFYLSAIDGLMRHPEDRPSIGMILCRSKNRVAVEYSLRDMRRPIGVASYELTEKLPSGLRGELPDSREIAVGLAIAAKKAEESVPRRHQSDFVR